MKLKIIITMLFLSLLSMIHGMDNEIQISKDLKIVEIDENIFVVEHSFPWPANSLIVNLNESNILLVDTPYSIPATEKILNWIDANFKNRKITAVNTGFHIDNLGGNQILLDRNIDIYGSNKTVELITRRGQDSKDFFLSWLEKPSLREYKKYYEDFRYINPNKVFNLQDGQIIDLDNDQVEIFFPGETHSPDNVVVYIDKYKLLFAGCMILTKNKTGNTADANLKEWPVSIEKLNQFKAELIIPGHGLIFTPDLLQKTIKTLQIEE